MHGTNNLNKWHHKLALIYILGFPLHCANADQSKKEKRKDLYIC